jgi:sulfite exporter TauE/SafE
MPESQKPEAFLTVEDAIHDLKTSAKEGEVTALLEAQVHLAFGDHEKAAATVKSHFDAHPKVKEKVQPALNALLESIKASKGQDKELFNQFTALGAAAGTNPCGICVAPGNLTGLWTVDPLTRKKVCIFCTP